MSNIIDARHADIRGHTHMINGMLRKMKTDKQNTPLNEMLICSIFLTMDNLYTTFIKIQEDMMRSGPFVADSETAASNQYKV